MHFLEGFQDSDFVRRGPATSEADQPEGDRDFPSDLHLNWSREETEPVVPPFTWSPGLNVDV